MGIVGVQKGYGNIRWLDMLGHRIFPRHFWVGKVQQLATAQSMHSMLFFGTNGLNKVYTVFRPSVFAISAMIFGRFICKLVFVWVHAIIMILWIYGFMDLSNCTIVR